MTQQPKIPLTVARELNRLNEHMTPFDRILPGGRLMHACLAIDTTINHASLVFRNEPLARRTALDNEAGLVLISLPRRIGGHHAREVLLGERGLGILTFIAQQADVREGAICALSPDRFRAALEELLACLDDAASQMDDAIEIPADEMTLRELRLKARSAEGKSVTRFEQLIKKDGAQLIDTDLDIPVEDEESLRMVIDYRIRKACVMGVRVEGLAQRLRAIYEFCTDGVKIDIEREVERTMPGAVPFRTFTEALGYTCDSFENAMVDANANAVADDAIVVDLSDLETVEVAGSQAGSADPATPDLFEHAGKTSAVGRVTSEMVLGAHRAAASIKASAETFSIMALEDIADLAQRGLVLLKRIRSLVVGASMKFVLGKQASLTNQAEKKKPEAAPGIIIPSNNRHQGHWLPNMGGPALGALN